jgi:transcriptional regulator with XRE-family HTH domain
MAVQPQSPTLRRRLGTELRRLREAAGLNIEQAGAVIYGSDSKISRLENGRGALKPLEIQALLNRYGADDERRRRLMQMVEEADRPEPWAGYPVPTGLETLLGLEADADQLEVFSASIIYGLFQTVAYARVTITEGRFADHDEDNAVEGLVALRARRQQHALEESRPRIITVIDEAAVRRLVGGREVMREQVDHLIALAERPEITVQVLPFGAGAHAAQTGSFLRLCFPADEDPDLVYCDGAAGNQYVKKPASVRKFGVVFDRLRTQALTAEETRRFLVALYKEYR